MVVRRSWFLFSWFSPLSFWSRVTIVSPLARASSVPLAVCVCVVALAVPSVVLAFRCSALSMLRYASVSGRGLPLLGVVRVPAALAVVPIFVSFPATCVAPRRCATCVPPPWVCRFALSCVRPSAFSGRCVSCCRSVAFRRVFARFVLSFRRPVASSCSSSRVTSCRSVASSRPLVRGVRRCLRIPFSRIAADGAVRRAYVVGRAFLVSFGWPVPLSRSVAASCRSTPRSVACPGGRSSIL